VGERTLIGGAEKNGREKEYLGQGGIRPNEERSKKKKTKKNSPNLIGAELQKNSGWMKR